MVCGGAICVRIQWIKLLQELAQGACAVGGSVGARFNRSRFNRILGYKTLEDKRTQEGYSEAFAE